MMQCQAGRNMLTKISYLPLTLWFHSVGCRTLIIVSRNRDLHWAPGHSGGYWQQAELRTEMVQAEQWCNDD